jgi:hypothetical protein
MRGTDTELIFNIGSTRCTAMFDLPSARNSPRAALRIPPSIRTRVLIPLQCSRRSRSEFSRRSAAEELLLRASQGGRKFTCPCIVRRNPTML